MLTLYFASLFMKSSANALIIIGAVLLSGTPAQTVYSVLYVLSMEVKVGLIFFFCFTVLKLLHR